MFFCPAATQVWIPENPLKLVAGATGQVVVRRVWVPGVDIPVQGYGTGLALFCVSAETPIQSPVLAAGKRGQA